MAMTRTKVILITVPVVALALIGGLVYVYRLPPFTKRGEIEASAVCTSLGDKTRAANALRKVLPEEASYSFTEDPIELEITQTRTTYLSDCFVYGNRKQLLAAKAETLEYNSTDEWVEEAVGQLAPLSTLKPFSAGDRAVASDQIAAIYVPCLSRGVNRHLSVIMWLKRKGEASSSTIRRGLIDLARSSAEYAHSAAKCDVEAKL